MGSDINSDKPWSARDDADLMQGLRARLSLAELARFLCRDIDEVRARAAMLDRRRP